MPLSAIFMTLIISGKAVVDDALIDANLIPGKGEVFTWFETSNKRYRGHVIDVERVGVRRDNLEDSINASRIVITLSPEPVR